ncbi:hypothetical protein LIER_08294 [Lithospermum erythrorhizon]|uniref:EF-hand domain-containing protein n=1 Tax=Lithospermum erythrorhizon TaxID=34254 RepID=A0AAV3PCK5_LITER
MEKTNPSSSVVGCMLICYKAASDPLACLTVILSSIFISLIIRFPFFDLLWSNALKWFINAKVHVAPADSTTKSSCSEGNGKSFYSSSLLTETEMVMERLGIYGMCFDNSKNIGSKEIMGLFEEEEPRMEEVKEAFDVFDENGDGFIDAKELKRIIGKLGFEEASEVECQRMIKTFDCDGDGRISVGEFVKLLEYSFF